MTTRAHASYRHETLRCFWQPIIASTRRSLHRTRLHTPSMPPQAGGKATMRRLSIWPSLTDT